MIPVSDLKQILMICAQKSILTFKLKVTCYITCFRKNMMQISVYE